MCRLQEPDSSWYVPLKHQQQQSSKRTVDSWSRWCWIWFSTAGSFCKCFDFQECFRKYVEIKKVVQISCNKNSWNLYWKVGKHVEIMQLGIFHLPSLPSQKIEVSKAWSCQVDFNICTFLRHWDVDFEYTNGNSGTLWLVAFTLEKTGNVAKWVRQAKSWFWEGFFKQYTCICIYIYLCMFYITLTISNKYLLYTHKLNMSFKGRRQDIEFQQTNPLEQIQNQLLRWVHSIHTASRAWLCRKVFGHWPMVSCLKS